VHDDLPANRCGAVEGNLFAMRLLVASGFAPAQRPNRLTTLKNAGGKQITDNLPSRTRIAQPAVTLCSAGFENDGSYPAAKRRRELPSRHQQPGSSQE